MIREFLQRHLIRFIVKDVFHTFSKDDILKISDKGWEYRGKLLTDETIGKLKEQAKVFSESKLWEILKAEVEWNAIRTLLEKGSSDTDIRIAQISGFQLQEMDRKMKSIISERTP